MDAMNITVKTNPMMRDCPLAEVLFLPIVGGDACRMLTF